MIGMMVVVMVMVMVMDSAGSWFGVFKAKGTV